MDCFPRYRGRFAPSPSGPLHAGSLAAALASWLDARAHGGSWLVRIEDLDGPRVMPGAAAAILEALSCCGLESDEAVQFQSQLDAHDPHYQSAFDQLVAAQRVFPCACSRKDVALAGIPDEAAQARLATYPGTCRAGLAAGKTARAWRFRVDHARIEFTDRFCGVIQQDLGREVGDFIVRRADGPWAYQLAVVVDDGRQAITHVVRGADLIDNTARQIALQRALGLPCPAYLHVPLVVDQHGKKLSKQSGAPALDPTRPLAQLALAAAHLGLPVLGAASVDRFLRAATEAWAERVTALASGQLAAGRALESKETP